MAASALTPFDAALNRSATRSARRALRGAPPSAVYRGPPSGPNRPGQNRLIIPGQPPTPSSTPPGLIIPGGPPKPDRSPPSVPQPPSDSQQMTVESKKYRPPPGFMNEESTVLEPEGLGSAQEMLTRLRTGVGSWQERARSLTRLHASGYDVATVEESTGLPRAAQNRMTVGLDVYESLERAWGKDIGDEFEVEGSYDMLYEIRFLAEERRAEAARFILNNQFSPEECRTLARAMREHKRRQGSLQGFTDAAGDCLAFKYYNNALETRLLEQQTKYVEKGIEVAVSESAIAMLRELLSDSDSKDSDLPRAKFPIFQLTADELGYRVIPVIGTLGVASANEMQCLPEACHNGCFGIFSLNGAEHSRWVALPQWRSVEEASKPIALEVANCSEVSAVVSSAMAKTPEEIKKLNRPGILVVDTPAGDCKEDCFYLAANGQDLLHIVDGAEAQSVPSKKLMGLVLFVCQPPRRESAMDGLLEI